METIKFRRLELRIVEAKEVVHDDVASEGWKCIGEVQRLLAGFEFLHSNGERVNMAVDDVDEVEDGAAGKPGLLAMQSHISLQAWSHVKIGV
jgi:hypothetical protein